MSVTRSNSKILSHAVFFGAIFCALTTTAHTEEIAEKIACAVEDNSIRSEHANHSTEIYFVNEGRNDKSLYWLNYSGKRVFYKNLAPGESYAQQTFLTHPWVITSDDNGTCEALFLPRSEPSVAILK